MQFKHLSGNLVHTHLQPSYHIRTEIKAFIQALKSDIFNCSQRVGKTFN